MRHAELGASSASRWKRCPGSPRLIRELPERGSDKYAARGQGAHAIAEDMLRRGVGVPQVGSWFNEEGDFCLARPPVGSWFNEEGDFCLARPQVGVWFEMTQEQQDAITKYVDHVRDQLEQHLEPVHRIEEEVYPLPERRDMFGTADSIIYDAVERSLQVTDYKNGAGVYVAERDNEQALYYACGAWELFPDVERIEVEIVQPRICRSPTDKPIRVWETTPDRLRQEQQELREAASKVEGLTRKAEALPGPIGSTLHQVGALVPGDKQCRFCPALILCPAIRAKATTAAIDEFGDLNLPEQNDGSAIAAALEDYSLLSLYVSRLKPLATAFAERGGKIPNWKLVEGRQGNRTYKDKKALVKDLQANGVTPERYNAKPAVKSPAQLEKVAGCREIVARHVYRPDGKPTLVPETDKRQAMDPGVLRDFQDDEDE